MVRNWFVAGLLAGAWVAPSIVLAQGSDDAGFYVGATIGQTKVKDFCSGTSVPGVTCEDTDTSFRILGGYQFNKNFAVELGYHQLGEVSIRNVLGQFVKVESTVWEAVVVGMLPLGER